MLFVQVVRLAREIGLVNLGAIAVDGKLVDRPVWLLAQSLVAEAQTSGHAAVNP